MAISEVTIANRALQKLGELRIEALSQSSKNARSMNAAYATVRDAELRRYSWGFAIKRVGIAADSAQSEWGDWNRFSKPGDMIRLLRDDETGQAVDWKIEGDFILSMDAAPLYIRYVARIEDPNVYDSLFVEALACKLAFECCEEITQSSGKKDRLKVDYKEAIDEAKRIGAIEKDPAAEFPEDNWLNARL